MGLPPWHWRVRLIGWTAVSEQSTYRFGPRPRRGVALGLAPGQALSLLSGVVTALVLVLATGNAVLGLGVLAAAGAWAFLPFGGRAPHAWVAPLAAQLFGPSRARAPLAVRSFAPRPHVPGPHGRELRRTQLPGLGRMRIDEVESDAGPVGLVHSVGGSRSFTLAVSGPRFALEDGSVQAAVVGSWGAVLGACASSRVRRLQVTERTVPDLGASEQRWLAEAATPAAPGVLGGYRNHLEACLVGAVRHEVYLTAALPARLTSASAGSECAAMLELLSSAGFLARPLGAGPVVRLLRDMLGLDRHPVVGNGAPLPAPRAWERRWELTRTDAVSHVCFEAAELPRVPVAADWTWPLLEGPPAGTQRRLALHIELAPPAAGLRRAQRSVLAHEGDDAVRAKWGFRSGARLQNEADAARDREEELAAGFADARFALVLAVSAPDTELLETSVRQAQTQAAAAHVELRRLYGQQAEALVASLPLTHLRLAGGWG